MNNTLKDYAKLAKKRMASGYWGRVREEVNTYIENNQEESPEKIKEMYSKRLMRELYLTDTFDKDADLYKKVCKLLSQDGYVLNPISQLIDHAEFDRLDDIAKQTYLIKLTDKYNELRERYEKEKNSKIYGII